MAQVVVGKNEYVPKDQNMDYEGNDIGQVKQSVSVVLALHTCACLSVLPLPEGERSGLGVSVVLCVTGVWVVLCVTAARCGTRARKAA